MEHIPENWPLWAGILATLLLQFRGEIAGLLQSRTARSADRDEHDQEIEEIQLNARLQTDAAEQLRKSWRDEQYLEIVQDQQTFIQDLFRSQADELRNLQTELRGVRRAVLRTGDTVASLIAHSKKENGNLIVDVSHGIEEELTLDELHLRNLSLQSASDLDTDVGHDAP